MWFRLNLVARGLLGVWASGACVHFVVHGLCGALADSSMLLLTVPRDFFPLRVQTVLQSLGVYTFRLPKRQETKQTFVDDA